MKEIDRDNILKLFSQVHEEDFSTYSKPYFFTNEMIASSLSNIKITNNEKAFSIMASGDHPLNLICKGFKKIDTIDSNDFCKDYFFGIKLPALIKYNYKEFIEFFDDITDYNYETNDTIKDVLDNEFKDEWLRILDYANENKKPISDLFRFCLSNYKKPNLYLENEDNYDKTRENLKSTRIRFNNMNVKDLSKLNGKYDLIHLSNVLEYRNMIYPSHRFGRYNYENYKSVKLLNRLYKKNLNDGGNILFYNFTPCDYLHEYKELPKVKTIAHSCNSFTHIIEKRGDSKC